MGPAAVAYACRDIVNDSKLYDKMKHEVQLTTKALTVDDLKNTDHVGFVDRDGDKGHVIGINGKLKAICIENTDTYKKTPNCCYLSEMHQTIQDALGDVSNSVGINKLYLFDTRRELYQWLAGGEPTEEHTAGARIEFDVEGLENYVDNVMDFENFQKIPGVWSKDKAEYLINLVKPFIK